MPRQPRLDAPDTLHHVMVRGIERTTLFRDDGDRADFLARLAALAEAGALTVYPSLRALARSRWTGHSALLGTVPRPWQDTRTILAQFGPTLPRGRKAYRAFIAAGGAQGRRPEFQGGGLLRSHGGWAGLGALRRAHQPALGDVRVLGGSAFVARCQRAGAPPAGFPQRRIPLARLVAQVCRQVGWPPPPSRGVGAPPGTSPPGPGLPISGPRSSAIRAVPWPACSACAPPRSTRRPAGGPLRAPPGSGSSAEHARRRKRQRRLSCSVPITGRRSGSGGAPGAGAARSASDSHG